ncbi:Hypothetical predicted protein [Pelobates cultripes]|uniref:Uncharacterized protein n=1 Tax=Pelobates cultripes TaxID=61616 RepID=A0AAD1R306_PELCU|nr:Hypothetical predicted protein [Pelobates cultripes]
MVAATASSEPNSVSAREAHSDIMQSVEATFAQFWHDLNERLHAHPAAQPTTPKTSKPSRPHVNMGKAPPYRRVEHKYRVVNSGKRRSTPGKAAGPRYLPNSYRRGWGSAAGSDVTARAAAVTYLTET